MKKNFSQSFLKPTPYQQSSIKNSSIQKPTPSQQPVRRPFTRKPGGACLPLSRKRGQQPATQIDTTMQLTNISQILQKTKNVKFISCRSQASLNGSVISKSNGSLSFANSVNDEINQIGQFSRILPQDSISPEKENAQREIFRRKSGINIRTPIVTKKKYDQSQNFSMMTCKARNIDNAQQETKLESSQFSDLSKSYCAPQSILTKNLVHSKNSSKDSMRKSNSSNSLIKKDPSKQCQQCQECQLSQRQIKDLNVKLERLQRIVKNKDQQIGVLNKKLQQNEKKIREMDRKIKDIEKQDFVSKVQMLEEQLNDSQEECARIKEAYTKTMQQLKYKNVQNQTFKKYQAQCQALERKMQLLVSERNELRQRLSSARLSSKEKSNSYTNYPSTFARQSKGPHNLVVNHSKNLNTQNMRQTLTSRNQECGQFQDDFPNQNDQSFLTVNDGWKKKSRNVGRCYEDSSDTEIISLSEQSNF